MFISGGLIILVSVIMLAAFGVLLFTRGFGWFGRLPGDLRYEGRRTRVYAPLASMLLLSVIFSLAAFLLSALF